MIVTTQQHLYLTFSQKLVTFKYVIYLYIISDKEMERPHIKTDVSRLLEKELEGMAREKMRKYLNGELDQLTFMLRGLTTNPLSLQRISDAVYKLLELQTEEIEGLLEELETYERNGTPTDLLDVNEQILSDEA